MHNVRNIAITTTTTNDSGGTVYRSSVNFLSWDGSVLGLGEVALGVPELTIGMELRLVSTDMLVEWYDDGEVVWYGDSVV